MLHLTEVEVNERWSISHPKGTVKSNGFGMGARVNGDWLGVVVSRGLVGDGGWLQLI